ncbi:uncharacterized protein LOC133542817 isoform X1 [Nerophis ophidion]|uniref:uncharacterized protein LOC133542817 isoform X1 n=1 Tax=Nerophis ophidion TaxID=159077 RepID=UPI002ADF524B|nr:uncharacterized protein LOC133542817 isoform X1 [Nerophis ophidion]
MGFPPQSSWLPSGRDIRTPPGPTLLAVGTREAVFQEVFMGCTIYAASPKALPADEAAGQDTYYPLAHYRHLHGNCSQRIAARARSMTEQQEHAEETGLLSTQDLDSSKDEEAHGHLRFQLIEELSYEDVKKCYRGSCVSCSDLFQAMDECVCVYGANVLSLVQSSPPLRERVVSAVSRVGAAGGWRGGASAGSGGVRAKELLMTLPCPSAQTVSKYNSQYHKLFQCVPKDELLMKGNTLTLSYMLRPSSSSQRSSKSPAILYFCIFPDCHQSSYPVEQCFSTTVRYSPVYTYSGAKKYLVSHRLCKFSHLK